MTPAFGTRNMFGAQPACVRPAARQGRLVASNALAVRPYTVRNGDTLTTIAKKRGFEVPAIVKLNHEIDPDNLKEGQTILLPAGGLSTRDREILAGMDRGQYRTYPVRKGEILSDILSKRQITVAEFEKLNPEVDPEKPLAENLVVKLPMNKYTVREREMLTSAGVPQEFFSPGNVGTFTFGIVVGVGAYAFVRNAISRGGDELDSNDDIGTAKL